MRQDIFESLLKLSTRPRLHGNGMIQWYVQKDKRLHIHEPMLRIPGHNATIHDHVFTMSSTVLGGTIRHRVFDFKARQDGCSDMIQFANRAGKKSSEGSVIGTGNLELMHSMSLPAGSCYYQKEGTLHDSTVEGKQAVTLITKHEDPGAGKMARVICPHGVRPTDAFGDVYTPPMAVLLDFVENCAIATHDLEEELLATINGD